MRIFAFRAQRYEKKATAQNNACEIMFLHSLIWLFAEKNVPLHLRMAGTLNYDV